MLGKLYSHMQKMKLDLYSQKIIENGLKIWMLRPEITKLLEENLGCKLHDICFGDDVLDLTSKAKINKLDYIKLKSFCTGGKLPTKWKGNLTNGRKYLQIIYLIKS